ncbi:DNA polymerase III subunit gamma/tau [Desulfosarcina sp. OttesenSCG-928-A07]|nr:DNA polymerase III subunit gamma/tau [Desulfosarcina sp. OttesenSCG-928-G17]MDL2330315.1 DNA polymerase III subunit gamma/tau [Desulfosarcina sp. OttesenSCG-928-A07]
MPIPEQAEVRRILRIQLMGYLVLARKYRPQTFDDVVGQPHVTQTLKNAIKAGRVAHAILFAGPRGTGKTTIARILAKAMNCEAGPTETPCNHCPSCMDITAGRAADVFEIDGASNNSVEQVRELRENCRYMPAHSRFRIYIIDEVHMLSIAAFNALLKILEEPPAHVMFFFATTESHKIPITILSRCQRHDLRRIDAAEVVAHMEALCREESMAVSTDKLWTIARESGGSMRDALSLLDQVMVSSDGHLADDSQIMALLGCVDRGALFDLSAAVLARDMARTLSIIDAAFKNGQDMKRFYADLMLHFRHLMLVKMGVGADILTDVSPSEMDIMAAQTHGVSTALLDQILTLLMGADTAMRHASQPRLVLEMVFFKIFQVVPALPIDDLITRIDALLKDPRCRTALAETEAGAGISDPAVGEPTAPYGYGNSPAGPAASSIMPGEPPAGNEPPASQPGPPSSAPHASVPPESSDMSLADIRSADVPPTDGPWGESPWENVLSCLRKTKPGLAVALSKALDTAVSPAEICVTLPGTAYIRNLVNKQMPLLRDTCRQTGGGRKIEICFTHEAPGENEKIAALQKADDVRQKLMNHPLVADAMDIFSGELETIIPEEEKTG